MVLLPSMSLFARVVHRQLTGHRFILTKEYLTVWLIILINDLYEQIPEDAEGIRKSLKKYGKQRRGIERDGLPSEGGIGKLLQKSTKPLNFQASFYL